MYFADTMSCHGHVAKTKCLNIKWDLRKLCPTIYFRQLLAGQPKWLNMKPLTSLQGLATQLGWT